MITQTRKDRIIEEKRNKVKQRRIKLACATLAATIASSTLYAAPKQAKVTNGTHIVKEGDSLYRISKVSGVSINELMSVNKLTSDKIYIGQTLEVPESSKASKTSIKNAAVYTVAPGDTLWAIAGRFGTSVEKLKKQNNLTKDMVLIGQKLTISDDIFYKKAKIVGAVDKKTVEFVANKHHFVLMVPYGTAESYQKLAGKEVIVSYKNGALIQIQ